MLQAEFDRQGRGSSDVAVRWTSGDGEGAESWNPASGWTEAESGTDPRFKSVRLSRFELRRRRGSAQVGWKRSRGSRQRPAQVSCGRRFQQVERERPQA